MKKYILSTIATVTCITQLLFLQSAQAELIYPVTIDSKAAKVSISKIKIQKQNDNWVLSGKVKRRSYNSHVSPGHIKYSILSDKGQVIKQGATNYSPSLSSRRWKYGSRFSFVVPGNLPEGTSIRLGWHHHQSKQSS